MCNESDVNLSKNSKNKKNGNKKCIKIIALKSASRIQKSIGH